MKPSDIDDPEVPLNQRVNDIEQTAERIEEAIDEFVSEDLQRLKSGLEKLEALNEEELQDLIKVCKNINNHQGSDQEVAQELSEEMQDIREERKVVKAISKVNNDLDEVIDITQSGLNRLASHSQAILMNANEEYGTGDGPAQHISVMMDNPLE